jgi:hypothetical protein
MILTCKKPNRKFFRAARRFGLILGKRYYEPESDGMFKDIGPAHKDMNLAHEGYLHLGFREEEITSM